jgi:hypothetical protein
MIGEKSNLSADHCAKRPFQRASDADVAPRYGERRQPQSQAEKKRRGSF